MSHDNTMTLQEAATFLQVTDRTIRNYIKNGLLSKTGKGKSARLPTEEVISLREDRDSTAPIVSRQELLKHRAKIRRLEANMEVVLRMLDAKDAPLSLNPEYSKELYAFAQEHLKKSAWDLSEIKPWLDIFCRLSEEDLDVMRGSTGDLHPWKVFLRLCTAMMSFVVSDSEYRTSIEHQHVHRMLADARRKLRVSSFIYGEMMGSMHAEITSLSIPTTTTDLLFRKILKDR